MLWVGSTVHGDEIPDCEVIRRRTRERLNPKQLRGTLLAAPVQHPVAFMTPSRYTQHDGVNINRVFPGNPNGTLTRRIAHDLFSEGVMQADAMLDIHSNAIGAVSFNVVRTGGSGKAWDIRDQHIGGPVGQLGLSGTPRDATIDAGKPALTIKLSGATSGRNLRFVSA